MELGDPFETDHLSSVRVSPEAGTDYVRLGDQFAVPRRFFAQVTPVDTSLPMSKLHVVIEDGRPICIGLSCERHPGGAPLTSALLRRLPIALYVGEVTTHVAFPYTHEEAEKAVWPTSGRDVLSFELDGRPAWQGARPAGRSLWQESVQRRDAVRVMSRQPRRGIPITDDDLREVAEIYRAAQAVGQPPTAAVMERHHVARATASRWVARARQRGYLGSALRGRAGEASDT